MRKAVVVAYFKTPFRYLHGETDHHEKGESEERISGVGSQTWKLDSTDGSSNH
jgi:hypothetical protein